MFTEHGILAVDKLRIRNVLHSRRYTLEVRTDAEGVTQIPDTLLPELSDTRKAFKLTLDVRSKLNDEF